MGSRRSPGTPGPRRTLPVESAVATKLIAEADRGTKERLNVMGFFSKDIKTMDDLFVHTLRDIYYAEKQALPEMIHKASDPQLKQGFRNPPGRDQATRDPLGRRLQVAR
jgi:Domain of unknown function (DUF892)